MKNRWFAFTASILSAIFVSTPALDAAPVSVPSQAPCTVKVGGLFHIGLHHITGGKCAETPVPTSSSASGQGSQSVRGATSGTPPGTVIGYNRTCTIQDGHDVCTTRSGQHVSTCTQYSDAWRCTETSRKTAAQQACADDSTDPVPSGPVFSATSYSAAGANAYVRAHDVHGLLAYVDGWTQAKPNDPDAWNNLGLTYGSYVHNDGAAAAAFRRTIALKPSWALPYVGLAHAYLNQKCFDLAGETLEKAADRNPTSASYLKNAAAAYSYAGRLDLADEMLIKRQEHLGHADSLDWYNLGCDYNKINDAQRASVALRRSLNMNGGYANAWNNLGVANENLGNNDDALSDYQKASNLGDSLGGSNYSHLKAAIAQLQRRSHRRGGSTYGLICYDGATSVPANGATGSCPAGFGVHSGDRSDDSSSGAQPAEETAPSSSSEGSSASD